MRRWQSMVTRAAAGAFRQQYRQQKRMLAGDRPPRDRRNYACGPGCQWLSLMLSNRNVSLAIIHSTSLRLGWWVIPGEPRPRCSWVGCVPMDRKLNAHCADQKDPEHNISWVLQCSWLSGIQQAALADSRSKRSLQSVPPLRLLFDPSCVRQLNAKVLLVSGSRDWVVPSGPEAIRPMRETGGAQLGHRLLGGGADHSACAVFGVKRSQP